MRKTVCSYYRGSVLVELIFDDWAWKHAETHACEDIFEIREISFEQAEKLFDEQFKETDQKPLEFEFLGRFPSPFIASHDDDSIIFDPKGWSLIAKFESRKEDELWDSFEWWSVNWIFEAEETWVQVIDAFHSASEGPLGPKIDFLDKREAADTLLKHGYRLPPGLAGFESIKVLSPQNAAKFSKSDRETIQSSGSSSDFPGTPNDKGCVVRLDIAETLVHLAHEFRSIRLISNPDVQQQQLTDVIERCGEAIKLATRNKLLPDEILKKIDAKPSKFNLFATSQAAIDVLGYWTPESISEAMDYTEDGKPLYWGEEDALAPGFVSEAWPGRFDLIWVGHLGEAESDSEFASRCRSEHAFAILGRYAFICETIGNWISGKLNSVLPEVIDTSSRSEPNREKLLTDETEAIGAKLWEHISVSHTPGVEPYRLAKMLMSGSCDYQAVCNELVPGTTSQSEKTKRFHAVASQVNESAKRAGVNCHVIRDPSNKNRVIVAPGFKKKRRREKR
ncbi:hypothetical protein U8335_25240 [Roseiconus lacunae]|uniref:hypothetical protein n=1 Tax=Roseiconus lacunae TaxID=2605694 RepID=UPI0030882F94|nr:hypothetical protein U8335_25240 [Stieleria sp. HD01]